MRNPLYQQLGPWLFLVPLAACGMLAYAWPIAANADLFLNLRVGQLITETGRIGAERIGYATGGADEVQSWLAQLIMWLFYRLGGEAGLRALHLGLLAATYFFLFSYLLKKTGRPSWSAFVTLLAMGLSTKNPGLQPRVFGEFLFSFTVFWLLAEIKPLSQRQVGLALASIAAWANLHESVVLAIPLYLAHGFFVRYLHREKEVARLFLVPIGGLAALCLNPVGWRFFPRTHELFQAGKSSTFPEWATVVPWSWENPFPRAERLLISLDYRNLAVYLSIATAIWVWAKVKHRRRSDVGYSITVSFFCIAAAVMVAGNAFCLLFPLALFGTTVGNRRIPWVGLLDRFHLSRALTAGIFLAVAFWSFKFHQSDVAPDSLEHAARFLKEAGMVGKILAPVEWGGPLAFSLTSPSRLATDRRVWVHREYFNWENETRNYYGTVSLNDRLKKFSESDLLLVRTSVKATRQSLPEWRLVYENNECAIFLRANEANRPNFERVTAYYKTHRIPFRPDGGFDVDEAWATAPEWMAANIETVDWGEWPESHLVDTRTAQTEAYVKQRQLTSSIKREP